MATHSNILPWEIPWTEEAGGLSPSDRKRVTWASEENNNLYQRSVWLLSPFTRYNTRSFCEKSSEVPCCLQVGSTNFSAYYLRSTSVWPSEKAMAPHSSTLAWKILRTEEPARLQSMGSLRVGHNWAASLSLFTFIGGGNGNPLQCSCLENSRDDEAWWAAIHGVTCCTESDMTEVT